MAPKSALLEKLIAERNETIDDNRRLILRAARVVFGRSGLRGATMEQIADEAGLGVATVYRYFETKDQLVRAFMEDMTPRPVLESVIATAGGDLDAELQAVVAALVRFMHELRDILRIALLGDEDDRHYVERLRSGTGSAFGWITTFIEKHQQAGHLAADADPRHLALSLVGMVMAFAMIGPEHYSLPVSDIDATAAAITSTFLEGARAR